MTPLFNARCPRSDDRGHLLFCSFIEQSTAQAPFDGSVAWVSNARAAWWHGRLARAYSSTTGCFIRARRPYHHLNWSVKQSLVLPAALVPVVARGSPGASASALALLEVDEGLGIAWEIDTTVSGYIRLRSRWPRIQSRQCSIGAIPERPVAAIIFGAWHSAPGCDHQRAGKNRIPRTRPGTNHEPGGSPCFGSPQGRRAASGDEQGREGSQSCLVKSGHAREGTTGVPTRARAPGSGWATE